jgi:hypothetical protein
MMMVQAVVEWENEIEWNIDVLLILIDFMKFYFVTLLCRRLYYLNHKLEINCSTFGYFFPLLFFFVVLFDGVYVAISFSL